ncbi:hypothetical protein POX_d05188 [Penicillium oxalicum]|uniref:Uncharacterized protein n=1 Tax=Penicillium oxalicum (strain 114-2 / CGMCC 5302) TaxID=933388 RepID=S7ZV69_PENO1|nr:hypothetical protein POX_d05188 [Penicillium oxalicum]EPS32656.1 hypothetical protein PDE_07616 [Penicillium oxalicum 114-2]KAI2789692.1 hypothetical protein POX_d05188 [Penicillium oxalicum]
MDDGETRFQTAELSIDWLSSAHPLWQEGSGGNAWSCVPLYSVLREDENIRHGPPINGGRTTSTFLTVASDLSRARRRLTTARQDRYKVHVLLSDGDQYAR